MDIFNISISNILVSIFHKLSFPPGDCLLLLSGLLFGLFYKIFDTQEVLSAYISRTSAFQIILLQVIFNLYPCLTFLAVLVFAHIVSSSYLFHCLPLPSTYRQFDITVAMVTQLMSR